MRKLLVLLLITSLLSGLCACKARTGASSEPEKRKGARENVMISENPRTEENTIDGDSKQDSESRPEENPDAAKAAAVGFLEAVKTGLKEKIQPYTDYNALLRITQEQNAEWQFIQILPHMTYEITSAKIEDGGATVSVRISNVDMGAVLPLWFEEAMRMEYDNALMESPLDRDALDEKIKVSFGKILNTRENGRTDKQADIKMEKSGGEWKPKNAAELGDAVLGGYFSAYADMAGNMGGQPQDEFSDYTGGESVSEPEAAEPED